MTRHNGRANLLHVGGNVSNKSGDDLFSDTHIAFYRGTTAANNALGNYGVMQANLVTRYFHSDGFLYSNIKDAVQDSLTYPNYAAR